MKIKRSKARVRFGWLLAAVTLAWAGPWAHGSAQPEELVVHVVLVWLKDAGNVEHRRQIIDATRKLADIPGVIDVHVGEPVPSDRQVVDDSFDVGLYLTFANADDMQAYLVDARHQAAVREIFGPLSERYIAYDFEDTGKTRRETDGSAE